MPCKPNRITVDKINGRFRSVWKFSGQSGPVTFRGGPLWQVGLIQPKLVVQFPKILVSSPTLLSSNQSFGHKANGIASIRLKILIDNSNGFWLFGLAKWKHPKSFVTSTIEFYCVYHLYILPSIYVLKYN